MSGRRLWKGKSDEQPGLSAMDLARNFKEKLCSIQREQGVSGGHGQPETVGR